MPEGLTTFIGQNKPLLLGLSNALGLKLKELKPQRMVSGVSDLCRAREPTYAPKIQTRDASVPIHKLTFKDCSS